MSPFVFRLHAAVLILVLLATPGWACDLCAVYRATDHSERGFSLGVAEQFTRFGTLQDAGEPIANPAHEFIASSITQLYGSYRPYPWLAVQLNLPLITRSFRRATANGVDRGDETGVGDMSVLAILQPYSYVGLETLFRFGGLVAVKMPSGSTDRLREELDAESSTDPWFPRGGRAAGGDEGGSAQHVVGDVVSGVHGHDLTLGTGSTDVILGGHSFASWRRFFGTAAIQYAVRTTGDFDYRFANDLLWEAGLGYFALLEHEYSLGAQVQTSGESKGTDTLDGVHQSDTAITSVYMGPALRATWTDRLSAEVCLDLPLLQNNSAVQLVPDYRIRGGVTWHF